MCLIGSPRNVESQGVHASPHHPSALLNFLSAHWPGVPNKTYHRDWISASAAVLAADFPVCVAMIGEVFQVYCFLNVPVCFSRGGAMCQNKKITVCASTQARQKFTVNFPGIASQAWTSVLTKVGHGKSLRAFLLANKYTQKQLELQLQTRGLTVNSCLVQVGTRAGQEDGRGHADHDWHLPGDSRGRRPTGRCD
jgi:hypothetical protein